MSRLRSLLVLPLLGAAACAVPARPGPPAPPPLAWRLVESPSPGGPELALESYDPSGAVRAELRFLRDHAAVGEVVEAEIRLPDAIGPHRLEIAPDRPGVELLGPREVWVEGSAPVRVRFTCRTPGRGGISVVVKE